MDDYVCINDEDIDDPTALDVADWICEHNLSLVTVLDWPIDGYHQFLRPRLSGTKFLAEVKSRLWKCSQTSADV